MPARTRVFLDALQADHDELAVLEAQARVAILEGEQLRGEVRQQRERQVAVGDRRPQFLGRPLHIERARIETPLAAPGGR